MSRSTAPGSAHRHNRPKANRKSCPLNGKIRYRDHREATDELQRLRNNARRADELGGVHTINVRRKYACKACKGWHLTSWETPTSGPSTPPSSAQPVRPNAPGPVDAYASLPRPRDPRT